MNRKASTLMSLGVSVAFIAVGIWVLCQHQARLGARGPAVSDYFMMAGDGMGIVMIPFWLAILSAIGLMVSSVVALRRSSGA